MNPKRLLIPGPVDIDDDVLQALGGQVTPHYGLDWGVMHRETEAGLRRIFKTEGAVYMIPGSGTSGTEAAFANAFAAGQRVIVCANGYFGQRLVDIAEGYDIEVVRVDADWGAQIDPEHVRAAFARAGRVDGLAIVHVETSTGVVNPVREIVEIANAHGAMVVVDAITALGAVDLDVDGWGIDLCVSATQKALAAPAGYGLLAVSKRGWSRIEARNTAHARPRRGWYLNLDHWRSFAEEEPAYHPHPVTVPPGNMWALSMQVRKILAMGLDAYIARHAAAAGRFRDGLRANGLSLFVDVPAAAPALSVVRLPDGVNMRAAMGAMRERHNLWISGGFGAMDGKVLRIGHMGKASQDDYIDAALAGLVDVLEVEYTSARK
jgi:alanine-glyoxylate transaminase / serine-glyoxylate transaminase / serine-pyruvate transaminase